MAPAPSWSDLPQELLFLIFSCLQYAADLLRCGNVCTTWRAPAMEIYRDFFTKRPPLLLIPNNDQEGDRIMLDMTSNEVYKVHLPEARGRWIHGTINGWLVILGLDSSHDIHLLNPFTRAQFLLPPRSTLQYHQLDDGTPLKTGFIKRAMLTSTPFDPDCVVLIIYSRQNCIAFCRIGDEKWTSIAKPNIPFFDFIFYKGQFYAMDNLGNFLKFELDLDHEATLLATPARPHCEQRYMVESLSGDLLLVLKYCSWDSDDDDFQEEPFTVLYDTDMFEVFKWVMDEKEWREVNNLGDEALFLGHNGAISVSATKTKGCKGNCNHFIDDYSEGYFQNLDGCNDIGEFDLGRKCIEEIYPSLKIWTSPFHWITPDV
ncbi:hypothetical protein RJ640_004754 [Escallonia rubra]|uniref:F-box domain-containing protein n=1 Tax=Escallonia rubra TaxID=112253 RepID=A0AA88UMP9_9ASTE|nr:hypothetical protein RJ640_004754 [Escallonia rubra]